MPASSKACELTRDTLEQYDEVEGTLGASAGGGDRDKEVLSRIAQLERENRLLRVLLSQLDRQSPTFH